MTGISTFVDLLKPNLVFWGGALIMLSSCSNNLLNPLEGGSVYKNALSKSERFENSPTERPTNLCLMPKRNLFVRAVENSRIVAVFVIEDSSRVIIAKGAYNAGYANLDKCYVAKGDSVKRGQIIGLLASGGTDRDNSLSFSLEKDGKYYVPKW